MFAVIIVIALALVAATTWRRNKDVFSPVKIGLVYMVLYFKPIFSLDCDFRLQLIYVGLLCILYVMARKEQPIKETLWKRTPVATTGRALVSNGEFWAAFIIIMVTTLGAVLYMVSDAQTLGGFRELAEANKLRVAGIKGLRASYLRLFLFTVLPYVNLAFYLLLFSTNRLSTPSWKMAFYIHLTVVVGMGVVSLSRGATLLPICSYLVLRNYCEKRVSPALAATVCGGLFVVALAMAIVRERFYFDRTGALQSGFELGGEDNLLESSSLAYGTLGLEAILEVGVHRLSLGSTFLSLFTQPIPRAWYPEKLETGGVYFTRYYMNDWGGTSYFTPTILGEFVMAFDWPIGIVLGYLVYFVIWTYVMKFYSAAWSYKPVSRVLFCLLLMAYLRFVLIATGLLVGEFTSIVMTDFYVVMPVLLLLWRRAQRQHLMQQASGRSSVRELQLINTGAK